MRTQAIRNPSYLTVSDDGQTVYAVSETNDADASLTIIRLLTDTHQDILLSHPVCAGFTPDK